MFLHEWDENPTPKESNCDEYDINAQAKKNSRKRREYSGNAAICKHH